jgi:hypothetical protein
LGKWITQCWNILGIIFGMVARAFYSSDSALSLLIKMSGFSLYLGHWILLKGYPVSKKLRMAGVGTFMRCALWDVVVNRSCASNAAREGRAGY